jgi:hypothetical protein
MKQNTLPAVALTALFSPLAALAGQPAEVEIYDRTDGRLLPIYWHAGERHIAGEPGHEYEIRVRNRTGGRLLAITSVDGVDVLSGRTASFGEGGYVLDPRGRLSVDGWRKNMGEVAAFYFTSLPDSYAARTGRPDNVGVIGVALYRERASYREEAVGQREPVAAPEPYHQPSETTGASDNAAPDPPSTAERESDDRLAKEGRLGTGHGQHIDSGAYWTSFERASAAPDGVIRIYYDSYRNLVAQGIIPRPKYRYAQRVADPFPNAFVPDP